MTKVSWILSLPIAGLVVELLGVPNGLMMTLALAILVFGVGLIWRPDVSPVFVFIFAYQWLQASTRIFHASFMGVTLEETAHYQGDIVKATVLSLFALTALGLGMHVGIRRIGRTGGSPLANLVEKSGLFWFRAYLLCFIVALAAQNFAFAFSGLNQLLLAFASLKWGFYWVLAHVAFTRRGNALQYWAGALFVELVLGFTGFFSDFKTPLIFTAFALLTARIRFSFGRACALATIAAVTIGIGVVWTAVKQEQRAFLTRGEASQTIEVSSSESLRNLFVLIQSLDGSAIASAVPNLLERMSYVDFFGRVLHVVPQSEPHTFGAIWADALVRPLMPRLLFPNKAIIDDTARTAQYTKLPFASGEGTSISIGYIGESYIDFGAWLMFVPIFLLGWLLVRVYALLVNYRRSGALGVVLASASLFPAVYLEMSITKLIGGIAIGVLISAIFIRFGGQMFTSNRGLSFSPMVGNR